MNRKHSVVYRATNFFFYSLFALVNILPPAVHADDVQVRADLYLAALRQTPGALQSMTMLTGEALPASGPLDYEQNQFLITQLFNSDGSKTLAYSKPETAAVNLSHGGAYLGALRARPGALASLQLLTGQKLPPDGPLTKSETDFLFTQLFSEDGSQTEAYKNPITASENVTRAGAYLTALRGEPGALGSLARLTGQTLPASGPLTQSQTSFLFTQLFNADGSKTVAYNRPVEASQSVVRAEAYLVAMRLEPGALQSLTNLTGQTLPSSGPLSATELNVLFGQLYNADGSKAVAYNMPGEAAQSLVRASTYLDTLRATEGGLAALQILTGQTLPKTGPLDENAMTLLFQQLFNTDGSKALAYNKPEEAAQGLVRGSFYLETLRATEGGLEALTTLTGKSLPKTGPLNQSEMNVLFEQLFNANGSKALAYSNPILAAQHMVHGASYLDALRATDGGLEALNTLTGVRLPRTGPLNSQEMNFLFQQLFNADGSIALAYGEPDEAAVNVVHGAAYLDALRATDGGLEALRTLIGQTLPPFGPLDQQQMSLLFEQLFNANGSKTLAFSNPKEAAQNIVHGAAYLDALRATPGGLEALDIILGQTLPRSGPLNQQEMSLLFEQLFNADGSLSLAYSHPVDAADTLVHGSAYLVSLRNTDGALAALQSLVGQTLPESGPLTSGEVSFLFQQLFNANGSRTLAYGKPAEASQNLVHASSYLDALRSVPGAMAAITMLTGQVLPARGPLNSEQIEFLFQQLFNAEGDKTLAYGDPVQAAENLVHAAAYLTALRDTPGALAALEMLTGVKLPDSGPLTDTQIQFLAGQLFDAKGNPSLAYSQPKTAAINLVHAGAYLAALRTTPGALIALQQSQGVMIPASGPLSASQIDFLFKQLFNADGTPTLAYTNPQQAVNEMVDIATRPSWYLYMGALVLGAGLALGLGLTGVLPKWGAMAVGAGAATLMLVFGPKSKDPAATPVPVPVASRTIQSNGIGRIPYGDPAPLKVSASPAPSSTEASGDAPMSVYSAPVTPISVLGHEVLVVGAKAPSKAYRPMFDSLPKKGESIRTQKLSRSVYEQYKWLAISENSSLPIEEARKALDLAGAANKDVTVVPSGK